MSNNSTGRTIGVLGAGRIGGTFGRLWAEQGHQIFFGVRDPLNEKTTALTGSIGANVQAGSIADAVEFSEVILAAIPWNATEDVIRNAGDFSGKILIDAVNAVGVERPGGKRSAAEAIAEWAPGARVVKAFNTLGSGNLSDLRFGELRADTFICGDDPEARDTVRELAEGIGFDVVDTGPLSTAWMLEALAQLWIHIAYTQGAGTDIAFKLLKRQGVGLL